MSTPDTAAEAMEKLSKKEHPIRIQRHKYVVASLRADLEKLKQAGGGKVKRAFLLLLFGKRQLPVEKQLDLLEQKCAEKEAEVIDGLLTPLSEAESWECKARYTEVLHYLATQHPLAELPEEGQASRSFAHDLAAKQAFLCARVHCALKKRKADGSLQRYFSLAQVSELDPRVVSDIADIYERVFVLSEDELGKS